LRLSSESSSHLVVMAFEGVATLRSGAIVAFLARFDRRGRGGSGDTAFDHREILDYALERLCNKLEYTTVGFQMLPERFSLTEGSL
jgi:hypothetical protein